MPSWFNSNLKNTNPNVMGTCLDLFQIDFEDMKGKSVQGGASTCDDRKHDVMYDLRSYVDTH